MTDEEARGRKFSAAERRFRTAGTHWEVMSRPRMPRWKRPAGRREKGILRPAVARRTASI